MKNSIFKMAIFVVPAFFAAFLIGCGKGTADYELDSHSFTTQAINMIQTNIGVVIPTGSVGLNMYYYGDTLEPSLRAKIQISPIAAEAFADQIRRITYDNVHDNSGPNSSSNKLRWWTPTEPDIVVNKQFPGPEGAFVQLILCHEKSDGRWILYVIWAAV